MIMIMNRLPGFLDNYAYKTWWIATIDDDKQFLIQISQDKDHPQWTKLENLLSTIPHIIEDALINLEMKPN